GDAVRGQLVLRQVDAAEIPVLPHVPNDVDQLQGYAEGLRALLVFRAVDGDAGHAHGARNQAAVAEQLLEIRVPALLGVLEATVDEVVQGRRRDRVTRTGVGERDEHRINRRRVEVRV